MNLIRELEEIVAAAAESRDCAFQCGAAGFIRGRGRTLLDRLRAIQQVADEADGIEGLGSEAIAKRIRLALDGEPVEYIDLTNVAWRQIQQAAAESKWIPPEYYGNDWVADVCDFLRTGTFQEWRDARRYQWLRERVFAQDIAEMVADGSYARTKQELAGIDRRIDNAIAKGAK